MLIGLILLGLIIWGVVKWWTFQASCFARMADKVGLGSERGTAWLPIARHYLFGKIAGIPALGIAYVCFDIVSWVMAIVVTVTILSRSSIVTNPTFDLIRLIVMIVLLVLELLIMFFIAKRFRAYVEFVFYALMQIGIVLLSRYAAVYKASQEALSQYRADGISSLIGFLVIILAVLSLLVLKAISDKNPDGYVPPEPVAQAQNNPAEEPGEEETEAEDELADQPEDQDAKAA